MNHIKKFYYFYFFAIFGFFFFKVQYKKQNETSHNESHYVSVEKMSHKIFENGSVFETIVADKAFLQGEQQVVLRGNVMILKKNKKNFNSLRSQEVLITYEANDTSFLGDSQVESILVEKDAVILVDDIHILSDMVLFNQKEQTISTSKAAFISHESDSMKSDQGFLYEMEKKYLYLHGPVSGSYFSERKK